MIHVLFLITFSCWVGFSAGRTLLIIFCQWLFWLIIFEQLMRQFGLNSLTDFLFKIVRQMLFNIWLDLVKNWLLVWALWFGGYIYGAIYGWWSALRHCWLLVKGCRSQCHWCFSSWYYLSINRSNIWWLIWKWLLLRCFEGREKLRTLWCGNDRWLLSSLNWL